MLSFQGLINLSIYQTPSPSRCLAQSHSDADLRISQMYIFIDCLRILKYIFPKNI